MTDSKFYFDPNEKGLSVFLGPSEAKLMEIAWKQKEISVKIALFYYPDKNKPAYTTVMTILSRLADKNLLRKKKSGRSFLYTPTSTKDEFIRERIAKIKTCLKQF